jgi:AmmeMemoRadiSam system protein B
LAEDVDTPMPALRDVRAQLVRLSDEAAGPAPEAQGDDDKTVVVLEDPEGLAPKPAILSKWAYALASLFDGERSARQAAEELGAQVGQPVDPKNVLDLQCELDKAMFLFSKRFERSVRRQLRGYLQRDVRPAAHAGTAYPDNPEALQKTIVEFFTGEDGPGAPWDSTPAETAAGSKTGKDAGVPPAAATDTLRALMLPHIDLRVGGATYAHGYAELLRQSQADLFVVLGVAHQSDGAGMYYVSEKDFATPLGVARTERGIARRLLEASDVEPIMSELAHRTEHSVEFQAVLLAALMGRYKREFEIVPVLCGPVEALLASDDNPLSVPAFVKFTEALRKELDASKRKWCILCSVDLSHVGPEFHNATMMTPKLLPAVERYDKRLLKIVASLDAQGVCNEIARTQNSRHVDAVTALLTTLRACEGLIKGGRLLHYDQMLKEGTHSAVSYAAMAFE